MSTSVAKIWGNPMSTCTKRVETTLKELNVPYELSVLDFMKGDHKSPDHLKRQPFGQVPVVEYEGFMLFESRAICRFFAAKNKSLIPDFSNLQEFAIFEQGASIELSDFDPPASGLMVEKVFNPMRGIPPSEEIIKRHEAKLAATLDAYEALLQKQKYIGGDKFTLVDIFHLPYGQAVCALGYDYLTSESRPNVARWWKEISSRDSWKIINERA